MTSLEGKEAVVSITGRRLMKREEIVCLRKFTHWDNLFPMDFEVVCRQLQGVVSDMCRLGLNLDLPMCDLKAIELNFPTDIEERRRQLVRQWFSKDPPCWWHLVQALKTIDDREN